jgi:CRP/FNR family nitrogen fixation transcriptional regulator
MDRATAHCTAPAFGARDNDRRPPDKLGALAATARYRNGQEICHQEGATESWYRVVSGIARRYAVRPSGRRQIVGLLLPGDLFGFPSRGEYAFSVEAVVEGTLVACYPRRRLEAQADTDPAVARQIREMAFDSVSRLQEQVFILGRTTALKKVGSFLLKLSERLSDGIADRIVLPMSRYDIADYLGLSVETVSRCLTGLKERGIIKLTGPRRVTIVDREALEEGSGGIWSDPEEKHRGGFLDRPAPPIPPDGFGAPARRAPPSSFSGPQLATAGRAT